MTEKICSICGKSFEPTVSRQKYCSRDCYKQAKKIARHEKNIAFREANPKIKKCPTCGAEFVKNNNQIFCSVSCRPKIKYSYPEKVAPRVAPRIKFKPKKCWACKKIFEPTYQGEKFCSDKCRCKYFKLPEEF